MAEQKERSWFRIEAKADEETTTADVHIYDEIGERWYGGGVGARSFTEQIDALDVDQINLHINSPGGAAWDGITIMNSLRRHKARVVVTVDGLAASAASVIAMAGDHIIMNRGSQMMIHDASGGAWGNAETMTEMVEILNKLSDSIADIYASRGGKDRAHWRGLMQAESWYTAEEAVTAGLADEWSDAPQAVNGVDPRTMFNLSMVASARKRPAVESILPSSTEPGVTNKKEITMSDTFLAGVAERLGVTGAEATEDAVLSALDVALSEAAVTNEAPALPEGVVAIEQGVLKQLQNDAEAGRVAREQQVSDRRDDIIAKALEEGRIAPASAEGFRAMLDENEERTAAVLDSMVKNHAVPVAEIGDAGSIESEEEAAYRAAFGSDEEGK